jgi:hypothetical protein
LLCQDFIGQRNIRLESPLHKSQGRSQFLIPNFLFIIKKIRTNYQNVAFSF